MRRRAPDGERGSATVWMLMACGVLTVVGAAAVLVGTAVVARHRATAAADLAALAGAVRAVQGADACGSAAEVAGANAADLTACAVGDGAVVEVAVSVPVRLGALGVVEATARARAGPVVTSPFVADAGQKTSSSSSRASASAGGGDPAGSSAATPGSARPP